MTETTLQPRLVIEGAARAIEFYQQAFGATELARYADDAGRIGHAKLAIGTAQFNLRDEGHGDPAPSTLGASPVFLYLRIADVDTVAKRMVAGGATVVHPVSDSPEGGRGGRLRDPFGHVWMIFEA